MFRSVLNGVVLASALSSVAFAQNPNGTALEAKAMLEKAVTELKADQTAALANCRGSSCRNVSRTQSSPH